MSKLLELVVCKNVNEPDSDNRYAIMILVADGGGYCIEDGIRTKREAEKRRAELRRRFLKHPRAATAGLRAILKEMEWPKR
jgi:hypothetical protein